MKVIATNTSIPKTILHHGKEELSGYFKTSVDQGIYLEYDGVKGDFVGDRIHHGGVDKACYIYGLNNYAFWADQYPNLVMNPGFFGENLTLQQLVESEIYIGDLFRVGQAVVQIAQPRQPCYKMGIRFGDSEMPNKFRLAQYPGIYLRVIEAGIVRKSQEFTLLERDSNRLSVASVFELQYSKLPDPQLLELAIEHPHLAESAKAYLIKKAETR